MKLPRTKDLDGNFIIVCRSFFLGTLGFHERNDSVIRGVFKNSELHQLPGSESVRDKCGHVGTILYNYASVQEHVKSYKPTISHYRRKHAPNLRNLPPDVTVMMMHADYLKKVGSKISYNSFYKIFKSMNISMALPGHEECEVCSTKVIHKKEFLMHRRRYRTARDQHTKNSQTKTEENRLIVSAFVLFGWFLNVLVNY